MWLYQHLLLGLAIGGILVLKPVLGQEEGEDPADETTTEVVADDGSVEIRRVCLACGDAEARPEIDSNTAYCDLEKDGDACSEETRMYNHTCDIFDKWITKNTNYRKHFERTCPEGVQSCYVAQGKYDGQEPYFRGCAGARFEHDERCHRELQAVQVVAGQKSVDVEVHLCYCNGDTCNKETSGAISFTASLGILGLLLLVSQYIK